jgi:hypothetical protein
LPTCISVIHCPSKTLKDHILHGLPQALLGLIKILRLFVKDLQENKYDILTVMKSEIDITTLLTFARVHFTLNKPLIMEQIWLGEYLLRKPVYLI